MRFISLFILIAGFFLSFNQIQAQDTIYTVDRISIPCRVSDIGEKYITYRKLALLNGPDFKMLVTRVHKIMYGTGEILEFDRNALIPEDQVKQEQKSPVNVPQSPPATTPGVRNTSSSSNQSSTSEYRPTNKQTNFKTKEKQELKKASFLIGAGLGLFTQKIEGVPGVRTELRPSVNCELGALIRVNESVVISPFLSFDLRNYVQKYTTDFRSISGSSTTVEIKEAQTLVYLSSGFLIGSFVSQNKGTGAFLPMFGLNLDYFLGGNYTIKATAISSNTQGTGSITRGAYNYNSLSSDRNQYLKPLDIVPRIGFMVLPSNFSILRVVYGHGLNNLFPGFINVPAGSGIPSITLKNRYLYVSAFFRI